MTPAGLRTDGRPPGGEAPARPSNASIFSLEPFGEAGGGLAVAGSISRRGNILSLRFVLSGSLADVELPAPGKTPLRTDRLWEETCLELFLAPAGSEAYWEFNLSPAGRWNVYRFARYREGMREEPAFASLPFAVRSAASTLELCAELDVGKIVPARAALEAGPAAVIRSVSGRTCHWALTHPGPRPDFHRRDGFRLRIPPAGGARKTPAGTDSVLILDKKKR